jgi:hypothetical protein
MKNYFEVSSMQVRLDIGEGKWLVFEDYGEKRKHLKVSVEDDDGARIVLGVCLKGEFKRAGRSA